LNVAWPPWLPNEFWWCSDCVNDVGGLSDLKLRSNLGSDSRLNRNRCGWKRVRSVIAKVDMIGGFGITLIIIYDLAGHFDNAVETDLAGGLSKLATMSFVGTHT